MFLSKLSKELGANYKKEDLKKWVWDHLKSGQVVPGYGHAVLRKTDPRYVSLVFATPHFIFYSYTCQREFAQQQLPNDPMFKLCSDLYEVGLGQGLLKLSKARLSTSCRRQIFLNTDGPVPD